MANELKSFKRGPALENSLAYMGSIVSLLAPGEETAGRSTVVVAHASLGNEPPPHVHPHEHVYWYVLEGAMEFFVEGEEESLSVQAGELFFLPAGTAHAMYIRTPEIRAVLIYCASGESPVRSDNYFRQMALGPAKTMDLPTDATTYAKAPDLQAALAIAEANGVTLLTPEETAHRLPSFPGFGANLTK